MFEVKLLGANDERALERIAEGVFDGAVERRLTSEFLSGAHNHIAVAIENNVVVGFASGIDYVHPDKPRQLWINEVGVTPSHQRRGIGRALVSALVELARDLGCTEAWVLTEHDNAAARGLYVEAGGIEEPTIVVTFMLDADPV